MATGLKHLLSHLQQGGSGLTDGQLLGRFIATREETAFAALVRRHGPMVLGVCRRVLHDFHDAEDAFQATFLVLARKAPSVRRHESVGSWLYGTAYRTAMEARTMSARRRARERPMQDTPQPAVAEAEAQDWRPLLDRELSLLPEKYRAAIVLCDLEGRTRRETAGLLKVPEGTLSSRLAAGRQMLAKRLARRGVALSGGAVAGALGREAASAQVPAGLMGSTVKLAALTAAGQAGAASTTAVLLMKGVMKAMLLKKLRLAAGAVVAVLALGAVGVGYQAGGSGSARAAPPDKPQNELEALRKENELLKLNLQVVLEKVRAQEAELHAVRKDLAAAKEAPSTPAVVYNTVDWPSLLNPGTTSSAFSGRINLNPSTFSTQPLVVPSLQTGTAPDPVKEAEAAVKALREAKDKDGQRRAIEALEKALEKLKQPKPQPADNKPGGN
jgi:RNA polymerase sigma factor (sigma-70 family)